MFLSCNVMFIILCLQSSKLYRDIVMSIHFYYKTDVFSLCNTRFWEIRMIMAATTEDFLKGCSVTDMWRRCWGYNPTLHFVGGCYLLNLFASLVNSIHIHYLFFYIECIKEILEANRKVKFVGSRYLSMWGVILTLISCINSKLLKKSHRILPSMFSPFVIFMKLNSKLSQTKGIHLK